MRQRLEVVTAVLVVIVLLAALAWAAPQFLSPLPEGTPRASPAATRPAAEPASTATADPGARVIVVSLAGMRPHLAEKYVQQGQMPRLAQLSVSGARAEYAQAVYPALTAPAHAAIAASAYADATGVVADTFHVPGSPIGETWRGLDTSSPVAPLWATASQQGQKTATICWPGANPQVTAQRADYAVGPGVRDAEPALHTLRFTRVVTETTTWTNLPASYSPWLESALMVMEGQETKYPIYALLVDATNDQRENYDTLFLDMDQAIDASTPRGRLGDWLALETDPFVHAGTTFKVISSDLGDFRVYQGAIHYNAAAPTVLLRALNAQLGFCPPAPDLAALQKGWLREADYLEMADRQDRWIGSAARLVESLYRPHLLFLGLPGIAAAEQPFLLVDERQPGYTAARAKEYEGYVQQAYRDADAELGRLMDAMDMRATTLFIVSDRGLAPVHTVVNVNKVLLDRGLVVLESGTTRLDYRQTQVYAVASGGTVHVYVNLSGREPDGAVSAQAFDLACDDIVAALRNIRDDAGAPVFPLILKRAEAARIHLNHPHSGDVIAFAAPGYLPSDALDRVQAFEPAADRGRDGYDALLPAMHGVFIAGGKGIRPGVLLAPVSALDTVPTVARLLDLKPAPHWQGQVLADMLER